MLEEKLRQRYFTAMDMLEELDKTLGLSVPGSGHGGLSLGSQESRLKRIGELCKSQTD